jgi:hypothetical protein
MSLPSLGPAPANQIFFGGRWVAEDSDVGELAKLAAPPPLKRVADASLPSLRSPLDSATILRILSENVEEKELLSQLNALREKLIAKQALLNEDGNAGWEHLEKKIQAIQSVLIAFA